jgi:hypothetical protein
MGLSDIVNRVSCGPQTRCSAAFWVRRINSGSALRIKGLTIFFMFVIAHRRGPKEIGVVANRERFGSPDWIGVEDSCERLDFIRTGILDIGEIVLSLVWIVPWKPWGR